MSNIDNEEQIEQAAEKIMGILTRDEPRKSFDSYAHHDTKDRAAKGLLAVRPVEEATIRKSRIVQPPTDKDSLLVEPVPSFKTCTQCGNVFETYKHGSTRPNKCKDCVKSNISDSMRIKNIKKKFEADADQYAKEHPENLVLTEQEFPATITLRFEQKRDARVYEAICASAENDRRTPENQVLHFLEMAFNGFGADVTFALEETINREEN